MFLTELSSFTPPTEPIVVYCACVIVGIRFRMIYYFDIKLVHAFIFIIPCVLVSLFKIWTKLVARSQAEIISRKLNEELVKLV